MSEKVDWVHKEISNRTSGKSLTKGERKKIYLQVWSEAKKRFD